MPVCYSCKISKDATEYYIRKNGHTSACKDCSRDQRLVKTYGITLAEFHKLLEEQNNACAICGMHLANKGMNTHIDHDHETNEVRGLLCRSCNILLGHALDDIDRLKSAIAYLEKYNADA